MGHDLAVLHLLLVALLDLLLLALDTLLLLHQLTVLDGDVSTDLGDNNEI